LDSKRTKTLQFGNSAQKDAHVSSHSTMLTIIASLSLFRWFFSTTTSPIHPGYRSARFSMKSRTVYS
jgi:hypothetical protein